MSLETSKPPEPQYERIMLLDHGASGGVYVGLEISLANRIRAKQEPLVNALRSLIVKKQFYSTTDGRESAHKELKVLKNIEATTAEGTPGHIFYNNLPHLDHPLSFDKDDKNNITAIYLKHITGCNLFDYWDAYTNKTFNDRLDVVKEPNALRPNIRTYAVPIPMIFHIFHEVLSTLNFMNRGMRMPDDDMSKPDEDRRMALGDIKAHNIMIREPDRAKRGLPGVTMIDYGSAVFAQDDEKIFADKVRADRTHFFWTMNSLRKNHEYCGKYGDCGDRHPEGWSEFCTVIEKAAKGDESELQKKGENYWLEFAARQLKTELGPWRVPQLSMEFDSIMRTAGIARKVISIHELERLMKGTSQS